MKNLIEKIISFSAVSNVSEKQPKMYAHYPSNEHVTVESLQIQNMLDTNDFVGGLRLFPLMISPHKASRKLIQPVRMDELHTYFETSVRSTAQIYVLDSIEKFENLSSTYLRQSTAQSTDGSQLIDFIALSRDYDGIVVMPSKCSFLTILMPTWDSDTLVIFNLNAIL